MTAFDPSDPIWDPIPEGLRSTLHERSAESREVLLRVFGGTVPKKPKAAPKPKSDTPRRGDNLKNHPSPYDRKKILSMYQSGKRVGEIAAELGAHRGTIHRHLSEAGVIVPGDSGGPRYKSHCKRNHDLAVHGKPAKGGGRFCAECKRIRERKS